MNISEVQKKDKNKRYFKVEVYSDSRSKKLTTKLEKIIEKIKIQFKLEDYDFLSAESSGGLSRSQRQGLYVFEKKRLDTPTDYDIIDKSQIKNTSKKTKPIKKAIPKINKTEE